MLFFRQFIASLEVHAVMKVANTETDKNITDLQWWTSYIFSDPPLARYFNIRMKLK